MIPLRGASHADVVGYGVDTPMRYSECYAQLADGRTVRLQDARQFIGWSNEGSERSLLFRSASGRILIPARNARFNGINKFVARDGSLMFVRRLGMTIERTFEMAGHAVA